MKDLTKRVKRLSEQGSKFGKTPEESGRIFKQAAKDNESLNEKFAGMVEQMTKNIQDSLATCIVEIGKNMGLKDPDKYKWRFKLIPEHAVVRNGIHLRYSVFYSKSHIGFIEIKSANNELLTEFTPNKYCYK